MVGQHHFDVHRGCRYIILRVGQEILHCIALGYHAHRAHLLQILLEAPSTRVQLLFAQLEEPFARQLRKVEAAELLAQSRVQVGKLAIATRAQLPAGHVDIEDNVAFPIPIHNAVVGYAGQR